MSLRLGFAVLVLFGLANQAAAFEISSPSVSNGKWAEKYLGDKAGGCSGQSVSIALRWKDPPAGTKSYALTMFDPDAGGGKGFWHWLAWNIPASAKGLAEGAGSKRGKGLPKGTVLGKGGIGRAGYFGPCPPPGSGTHHYVFTLYALGAPKLRAPENPSPEMVAVAAKSQALGETSVTYTYGR
ncbi:MULTISPECIES: YbhB/YbcL family Raf kinase inhibitor-like protein [unclassified Mesorhizobium]|uniref:YbhB/YbcL family Raf kinase inhibitor-like protein n=1 Tax=unclassified Mesorhizobium TaxID=325217 RepID=UPI0011287F79|nr:MULTISPECIES: YbhB/YbcL family Raf kinase inhibitor-like protein [unclassified Mesorhizobium]TPJ48870.1 YbhB/YbcL family Raf kinase inhibitor-like protein [Mesorhizobium sp. B2-6-6]MBZ9897763.1 YbhB/YbcL family Raf kinase inhibitor-like protein [Mesorhizobium sp. BR1-1-6]MBZ9919300.1 YbhB/YbcL family Raf kinase inhibitor-like protein [Mesorhizobium sp. BR1-1-7]MBZ9955045.1 YbhB/YbcL family Raf kinase inhibitor-like protein [Mesorhizobium sp. BR1-1-15]MBZ9960804.1 YbhB/YbcL family Raf kinase